MTNRQYFEKNPTYDAPNPTHVRAELRRQHSICCTDATGRAASSRSY
jgi:hypothetical protein